jgi:hypothetical protein
MLLAPLLGELAATPSSTTALMGMTATRRRPKGNERGEEHRGGRDKHAAGAPNTREGRERCRSAMPSTSPPLRRLVHPFHLPTSLRSALLPPQSSESDSDSGRARADGDRELTVEVTAAVPTSAPRRVPVRRGSACWWRACCLRLNACGFESCDPRAVTLRPQEAEAKGQGRRRGGRGRSVMRAAALLVSRGSP